MKKTLKLIIVFIVIVMLVGCNNDQSVVNEQTNQETNVEQTEEQESADNSEEKDKEESQGIGVDKNILTVDITLPAEIAGDLADFNEDEYLSQNDGMKAAKVNEDGSLTITMTKAKHKEMLEETRKNIDESLGELIEGENTPYIKNIDYSNDYREVIIEVVKEEYENAFDFTPLVVGFSACLYQSIAGIDLNTTIVINDIATGEEINSVIYPDAWGN